MMKQTTKCNINDLLSLFENTLSPAEVLSSKLIAQVSTAITKERVKLRMTQSEFAKHINVTQSQISRWEHGNYNFSLEKISSIATKLNMDVNISFTDMSIYKFLEEYDEETMVSSSSFSYTFKNDQSNNKSCIYQADNFKTITSNMKEDINYVTVR